MSQVPVLLSILLSMVQVVLASSDIVNVNASARSDWFKALKGGGNNFGIVTRFILPTNNTMAQLEFVQKFTTASGAGVADFAAIESIHGFNASGPTGIELREILLKEQ